MSKTTNNTKQKKLVKTKVRYDGTTEVDFQKNPKDTVIGKILLYLIIAGSLLVPLAGLVLAIIQAVK